MKNRKSKRQEKRKQLTNAILKEQQQQKIGDDPANIDEQLGIDATFSRKVLSIDEAKIFFQYINENKLSMFSLQSLHKINLNVVYPISIIPNFQYGCKAYSNYKYSPTHVSFLSYSLILNNDKIAHGLIRAGCFYYLTDHFISSENCTILISEGKSIQNGAIIAVLENTASPSKVSDMSEIAITSTQSSHSSFLVDLSDEYRLLRSSIRPEPSTYLLWILRIVSELRSNASSINSCQCCMCSKPLNCWNRCEFLQFQPCEHVVCAGCFWHEVDKLERLADFEGRNKLFLGSASEMDYLKIIFDRNSYCIFCNSALNLSFPCQLPSKTADKLTTEDSKLLHLPAMECKAASLQRFQSIDELKNEVVYNHLSVFKAAPLAESAAWLLGTKSSRRSEELLKAAEKGQTRRLAALIEAGVDLETRNEYGQTALFISVWQGQIEGSWLLLRGGASACVSDNSFSTILTAAMNTGNHFLLSTLSKWLHNHLEQNGFCADELGSSETTSVDYYGKVPDSVFCKDRVYLLKDIRAHSLIQEEPVEEVGLKKDVQLLIPENTLMPKVGNRYCSHPGAGKSFLLGGFFSRVYLDRLISLVDTLPIAEHQKQKQRNCSDRLYYCDAEGWVVTGITTALSNALSDRLDHSDRIFVFPHMRFLNYKYPGDYLAPHIDLTRTNTTLDITSTHTFILYLNDCSLCGGETVLLKQLVCAADSKEQLVTCDDNVLAVALPGLGRLLIFPHRCPHAGLEVRNPPKLLLRGEVYLSIK